MMAGKKVPIRYHLKTYLGKNDVRRARNYRTVGPVRRIGFAAYRGACLPVRRVMGRHRADQRGHCRFVRYARILGPCAFALGIRDTTPTPSRLPAVGAKGAQIVICQEGGGVVPGRRPATIRAIRLTYAALHAEQPVWTGMLRVLHIPSMRTRQTSCTGHHSSVSSMTQPKAFMALGVNPNASAAYLASCATHALPSPSSRRLSYETSSATVPLHDSSHWVACGDLHNSLHRRFCTGVHTSLTCAGTDGTGRSQPDAGRTVTRRAEGDSNAR